MFDYPTFIAYIFAMAFTPGPNTLTSFGNSTRYGFRNTIPYGMGIVTGVSCILTGAILLGSLMTQLLVGIRTFMTVVGSAYMIFVAYKLLKSDSIQMVETKPMNFFNGLFLQMVNPKVWIYCLTTVSVYIIPHFENTTIVLTVAAIVILACIGSLLVWSLFGSVFFKLLQKYMRYVNAFLAALLVYCAISLYR